MFKRKETDFEKTGNEYGTQPAPQSMRAGETYLGDDIDITVKQPTASKPITETQNATVIPETCSINGELNSTGDIHVNGKIEGVIRSDKAVHILKSGHVQGDVFAQSIAVDGTLKGNCIGSKVSINANGFVDGIIQSQSLAIDSEGCFYGSSQSLDNDHTKKQHRDEPNIASIISSS